jgi:hypothetical protein
MSRAETNAARLFAAAFLLALAALIFAQARQPAPQPAAGYGWTPDPEGVAEFLDELGPARYFAQAAPEAMAKAEHVDTFLYRAMAKAHQARYGKPWVCERQGIGDCVAWGAMHAVWCSESLSWDLGLIAEPPMLPSPESIYGGSRVEARGRDGSGRSAVGGWSDGSYGGAAAKWLRDWGVVYRTEIGGHDLRVYSSERAKQWGAYGNGGQGDGGKLDELAKRHPARHVVAVKTWDECVAALTAGFPITIASNQGFASRTDDSGILAPSGTWMHQMCLVGIRFKDKAPPGVRAVDACLVLNSWGTKWISYAGKYPADQPDGTFWATRDVIERILRQNDSYAIGDIKTGFRWRDIHHGDWLDVGPIETLSFQVDP